MLSWTLTISAPAPEEEPPSTFQEDDARSPVPVLTQSVFDPVLSRHLEAPVYLREHLRPGDHMSGPALISEDQTTTVVTSRYNISIDARGYIVLTARPANSPEVKP